VIGWVESRQELEKCIERIKPMAQVVEKYISEHQTIPGWCGACQKISAFRVMPPEGGTWFNLREGIMCGGCGLNGRMRMINEALSEIRPTSPFLMMERITPLFIKISEQYPFVEGCEFFGVEAEPGSLHQVGELQVRHENMLSLSYRDNTIRYLFHGDVLEHVPDWNKALAECCRVLEPGGTLLFTCPFFDLEEHLIRCQLVDGKLQHFHPPAYHGNPVDASGSLVFAQHGWPLLQDIREAGFCKVEVGLHYDPFQGIVSNNNPYPEGHMWPVIFKASKS